jgi:hypothetical protein
VSAGLAVATADPRRARSGEACSAPAPSGSWSSSNPANLTSPWSLPTWPPRPPTSWNGTSPAGPIEVAFHDAKNTTGVGEARNRTRKAVERTVPFGLYTQSIVIIWYHLAGHPPNVVRDRRDRAPWYATKRCPSCLGMIIKLRRVLIAAQYQPEAPRQPTTDEIRAVQLAWAQAAA